MEGAIAQNVNLRDSELPCCLVVVHQSDTCIEKQMAPPHIEKGSTPLLGCKKCVWGVIVQDTKVENSSTTLALTWNTSFIYSLMCFLQNSCQSFVPV